MLRNWTKLRQRRAALLLCISCVLGSTDRVAAVPPEQAQQEQQHDIVIYGGTSAGVIAAVQAKRMGKSVVVVCPETHLGGMTSGGLGWTDTGSKAIIGGLAREFYHRIWKHYQQSESWKWQSREEFGNRHLGAPAIDGRRTTMWVFEPHAAEAVFDDLIRKYQILVHRDEWLDRQHGVKKREGRIESITMLSGNTFRGRVFLDATYEGDLMAAAGVTFTIGREPNSMYNETLNGVQFENARTHQFQHKISPYVVPDDPESGLLPRVHNGDQGRQDEGDQRVQAYCFRLCLTMAPENRVPFPKPADYNSRQYELLLRTLQAGSRHVFGKFDAMPNAKTDVNNHGPFSTDNIGMNYDYPEASYERRREIVDEHRTYQQGYFWFLANDPRVPEDVRTRMAQWGLAKDEFSDTDHWPHQLYIREARRMVSDFVVTENHLRRRVPSPHPVGRGSYNMDSHHTQRYVAHDDDGRAYVLNEGCVEVSPRGSYPIDYGALTPKQDECANLLVPVCVSTSHIAYGSIRMEPVFMILGQSAATAAAMAIDGDLAVQDVDYAKLSQRLREDGQVLQSSDVVSSTRSPR